MCAKIAHTPKDVHLVECVSKKCQQGKQKWYRKRLATIQWCTGYPSVARQSRISNNDSIPIDLTLTEKRPHCIMYYLCDQGVDN